MIQDVLFIKRTYGFIDGFKNAIEIVLSWKKAAPELPFPSSAGSPFDWSYRPAFWHLYSPYPSLQKWENWHLKQE